MYSSIQTSAKRTEFFRKTLTPVLHLYGDRFLKIWPTCEQGTISRVPPHIHVYKNIGLVSSYLCVGLVPHHIFQILNLNSLTSQITMIEIYLFPMHLQICIFIESRFRYNDWVRWCNSKANCERRRNGRSSYWTI